MNEMNEVNKPSSHENGLASSSENDMSKGRTEQRAIALLPQSYPFELTESFQAAFASNDTALVLPSAFRFAYWHKNVAEPHWQRVQEETADYNRRVEEEFTQELAEIEFENQRRSERNRANQLAYDNQRKQYESEKKTYDRNVKSARKEERQARKEAKEKVITRLHRELDDAIDKQSESIDLAFASAVEKALVADTADDGVVFWIITVLTIIGLATFPTVVGPVICGLLAYQAAVSNATRKFDDLFKAINDYDYHEHPDYNPYYKFLLVHPGEKSYSDKIVYSPANFFDGHDEQEEPKPLGKHKSEDYQSEANIMDYIGAMIPPLGFIEAYSKFFGPKKYLKAIAARVGNSDFKKERRKKLHAILDRGLKYTLASNQAIQFMEREIQGYLNKKNFISIELNDFNEPKRPVQYAERRLPTRPTLKTAVPLERPADCFDTPERGLVKHVFKGSQVYGLKQVTTLARTRLFAGDQVRPHFTFGGVPFPIVGNSPHMLIVGTTGSGKTTTLLRLMSSLLPLSTAQARRLAERLASGTTAYPESLHQWGRSRTHQAVVYNAKGEYLQYLEAFGFDSEVDLFNLDPADPNGYAWDVAADIDSRESIKKFAEQLIPKSVAASQDKQSEFWNGTARKIVVAIIISLRNAARLAGKKPSWTLRDLVKIASNDNYIKEVLLWHDTPMETLNKFFGLHSQQLSSVMLTLGECMGEYDLVAEQWYHAMTRGRAISLKKWSLEGKQSVLVLPDTMKNVTTYAPLNKAVVKALAGIWLTEKYSLYVDDDGKQQKRHRFFIVDEFGEAGQFDELQRILSQGRTFGVHVVLGLHQLSQVRKAYGEEDSETIIGLCPYMAFLKNGDVRTQEWMSKLVGNCLRSYDKETFSYSTSNGVTLTETTTEGGGGSEGTNESKSKSKTKGTADITGSSKSHAKSKNKSSTSAPKLGERGTSTSGTGETDTDSTSQQHTDNESITDQNTTGTNKTTNWNNALSHAMAANTSDTKGGSKTTELRGEPAIEPSEFGRFADPETEGECEGVYITPTLPVFRTKLQMAQVQPEYEFPDKVRKTSLVRSEEEDEEVTRPTEWTNQDLERLFLDKPHMLPEIPHRQKLLDNSDVVKQRRNERDEQLLVEEQDAAEPPTPNFDFD